MENNLRNKRRLVRRFFLFFFLFSFFAFGEYFSFTLKEFQIIPFYDGEKVYDYVYGKDLNADYAFNSLPYYEEFLFLSAESAEVRLLSTNYEVIKGINWKEDLINKEIVQLEYLGKKEEKNLFKVIINPFFYEKESQTLKIYKKIDYEIIPKKKASFFSSESLLKIKKFPNNELIKIEICSTGVYEITYDDLKKLYPQIDFLSPEYFSLYDANFSEIPIIVLGEEDGKFEKNDRIIFFGKEHFSLYTLNNCYWLSLFNLEKGKRMEKYLGNFDFKKSVNIAKESLKIEYDNFCPARSGLLWVDEEFKKPTGINYFKKILPLNFLSFKISLEKIFLRFWLKEGDIKMNIYLNEILLDSLKGRGNPNFPQYVDILKEKEYLLKDSNNQLTFELVGNEAMALYFDYLSIKYKKELIYEKNPLFFSLETTGNVSLIIKNKSKEREFFIFDISFPSSPKLIENPYLNDSLIGFASYIFKKGDFYIVAKNNLKKPISMERKVLGKLISKSFSYDYLIITPKVLYNAALLLKGYRQKTTNLKIGIALLEDIYDEYGGGLREISAIKDFLKDKKPKYCLFLGDCNYDYRGLIKKFSGVPTYEWGYDYEPGPYSDKGFCFDAYFADFDGEGSSPDIILTRLPIRDEEEMKIFLKKLADYEERAFIFSNKLLLLLADDEYNGDISKRDPIWRDHYGGCEQIASLAFPYLLKKIYLFDYPLLKSKDKGSAKEDLIRTINKGIGLLCYFGHGSGEMLAHENIFSLKDIPLLENEGKYFFAFFGSCGVGRFDESEYECLAEELVRSPYGAIAVVAGSKATSTISNRYLAQIMFSQIFSQTCSTFSEAFFKAWYIDKKYHFFGEPLTKIPFFPLKRNNLKTDETCFTSSLFKIKDTIFQKNSELMVFALLPKRKRIYRSWFGEIAYDLPGDFFYRNYLLAKENKIIDSFFVPQIPFPDTNYLADGQTYLLNPSAFIFLVVKGKEGCYSLSSPPLFFKRKAPSMESKVTFALFADNQLLKETTAVNRNFLLKGEIYSQTGILFLSNPFACGFYLTPYKKFFDLLPYLSYYPNSFTNLKFSYPISLKTDTATLTFYLTDNLFKTYFKSYFLKVKEKEEIKDFAFFKINENLYGFAFKSDQVLTIRIKIYTLSGRLIKELKTISKIGNNLLYWDRKDSFGREIAKGIYLIKVSYSSLKEKEADFIKKIIID